MSVIHRTTSYILLVGVYCFTWLVAVLGYMMPRRSWKPTGCIMVTGTFFNPNWYLSHLTPLARSGIEEVILVVDEPQLPLKRVQFLRPPRWISKLLGRAGAKVVWMFLTNRIPYMRWSQAWAFHALTGYLLAKEAQSRNSSINNRPAVE